jgi:hypothetical protein
MLRHISDFVGKSKVQIVMAKAENCAVPFEIVNVKALERLLPFPCRE